MEERKELKDVVSAEFVPEVKVGEPAADDNGSEVVLEKASSSLCAIGDDSLSAVLSFLSPSDIVSCSAVCRHLRAFCKDDEKVWLPMCQRRWGAFTSVQKWGRRRVRFKLLYSILTKLENLVGFWRGVGHGGHGFLALFEWGPHYVRGHRIKPPRLRSFEVRKVPFVWIGVSDFGRSVCFFHPHHDINTPSDSEGISTSAHSARNGQSPSRQATEGAFQRDPFSELGPEWDLEQINPPPGLLMVDVHFVGQSHVVMEEMQRLQVVSNKSLTEAATSASFGSPGRRCADGSSPDSDKCGQSPPGSFHHEMFQFLSSKVASQGGERILRRQRRRERERAVVLGRMTCETEHFVKVKSLVPTASRPLEGLWKGICDYGRLDFLLIVYNDRGDIVCRRIGECFETTIHNSLNWTAEASAVVSTPLPDIEQDLFNCRRRIGPNLSSSVGNLIDDRAENASDDFDEEVVGVLRTIPIVRSDCGFRAVAELSEGRVWQYASGRFGFGCLGSDVVIYFRPLCCAEGLLLDSCNR